MGPQSFCFRGPAYSWRKLLACIPAEAECIIIDDAIDRFESAIEVPDEVGTVVNCTSANVVKLQGEVESDIACTVDNDIQ